MTDTTRSLSIRIEVSLDQPGDNLEHALVAVIPVPPAYQEADILPFVRHELDRAVSRLQDEQLGGSRASAFLAAYELRMRVIRHLLNLAPRRRAVRALAERIREVADASNDELAERWGALDTSVED